MRGEAAAERRPRQDLLADQARHLVARAAQAPLGALERELRLARDELRERRRLAVLRFAAAAPALAQLRERRRLAVHDATPLAVARQDQALAPRGGVEGIAAQQHVAQPHDARAVGASRRQPDHAQRREQRVVALRDRHFERVEAARCRACARATAGSRRRPRSRLPRGLRADGGGSSRRECVARARSRCRAGTPRGARRASGQRLSPSNGRSGMRTPVYRGKPRIGRRSVVKVPRRTVIVRATRREGPMQQHEQRPIWRREPLWLIAAGLVWLEFGDRPRLDSARARRDSRAPDAGRRRLDRGSGPATRASATSARRGRSLGVVVGLLFAWSWARLCGCARARRGVAAGGGAPLATSRCDCRPTRKTFPTRDAHCAPRSRSRSTRRFSRR